LTTPNQPDEDFRLSHKREDAKKALRTVIVTALVNCSGEAKIEPASYPIIAEAASYDLKCLMNPPTNRFTQFFQRPGDVRLGDLIDNGEPIARASLSCCHFLANHLPDRTRKKATKWFSLQRVASGLGDPTTRRLDSGARAPAVSPHVAAGAVTSKLPCNWRSARTSRRPVWLPSSV
jgi:hypothetical protein